MRVYRFSQSGFIRAAAGLTVLLFLAVFLWYCQKECCDGREENMGNDILAGSLMVPAEEEVTGNNGFIYRYNHELMREKGLAEGDGISRYYLCLQALYRANLDAYLLETLNLGELDGELLESGLGFESPGPEEKNLYERESAMGLKFIYLRNNLYIEYLDDKPLESLKSWLMTGDTVVTGELKQMAKETYREVIRVREADGRDPEEGFLYPGKLGREPEIPNDALVLGISDKMKYDGGGNFLPDDNREERHKYLCRIKEEKEKEYSRILGADVYILPGD